jgi:hypothetical protein
VLSDQKKHPVTTCFIQMFFTQVCIITMEATVPNPREQERTGKDASPIWKEW